MKKFIDYIIEVDTCIKQGWRWSALKLIKDPLFSSLEKEQQEDLYDLEYLAEESR